MYGLQKRGRELSGTKTNVEKPGDTPRLGNTSIAMFGIAAGPMIEVLKHGVDMEADLGQRREDFTPEVELVAIGQLLVCSANHEVETAGAEWWGTGSANRRLGTSDRCGARPRASRLCCG